MKTLQDLQTLNPETLRFNLWEKYGKRRIYINAQSDMKLFICEDKESEFNTDFGGMYINNIYDEMLFDDIDLFLSIKSVQVKDRKITFDDIVDILKNEGLLK